ncbi:galanin receptor type 1-like [Clytia hemisphaerica]|uniref:galanin receptor type 1-like n=1 Tax=Clytia hemisphaerica TaxID=252671 RepID=UPI0034D44206
MNSTTIEHDENKWYNFITLPLYSIGIVGNILVIVYFIVINKDKLREMSSYHYIVLHLTTVDLLNCLTIPLFRYFTFQPVWPLGEFACRFMRPFSFYVLPMLGCWFLVVLSFERYYSIMNPFKRRITKRNYTLVIVFLYLSTIGLNMDTMIKARLEIKCTFGDNSLTKGERVAFIVGERILDCVLPVVLMAFFYTRISKRIQQTFTNQESHDKKIKALHILKYLITLYVISVYPGRIVGSVFSFLYLYKPEVIKPHQLALDPVYYTMMFILNIHNMTNVFIFSHLISNFRLFLRNIFTGHWCKKEHTYHIEH